MDHEHASRLLPGYADGELSLGEVVDFEQHLAGCADCQHALEAQQRVSSVLKSSALQFEVPDTLLARIEAELHPRPSLLQRLSGWLTSRQAGNRMGWASGGALAVSAAALVLSGTLYLGAPSADMQLSQELVDNHVRSLQLNHLIDVVSTDRHTVKPWFNGKIDFAPPVLDLAQDGYPLIGGRLDYLDGRTVAVMIYRYKLHPINLYVWPESHAAENPGVRELQGYHLAHWTDGRMSYWAVTDAGASELDGFTRSLRAHAAS